MHKRVFIEVLLLLALSVAAVVAGAGRSYDEIVSPRNQADAIENLQNGWIHSATRISFKKLLPIGNRVALSFDPARPPGTAPAQLRIKVCGETAAEITVQDSQPVPVSLRGSCEPREVSFEVLNPFSDGRCPNCAMGVRLLYAAVESRAGVPLVAARQLVMPAARLFVASMLLFLLLSPGRCRLVALFMPVAGALLLGAAPPLHFKRVYELWLLFVSLAAGALAGRALCAKGALKLPPEAAWERWLVFPLVLFGGVLRFYGIEFGLPHNFHPDEVSKINVIMGMVQRGDLSPHYFLHPSLLLYGTYFINTVSHWFDNSRALIDPQWRGHAFLAGRSVSALAGTLSIYLLYALGARFYTRRVGLLAAAILTFLPLHAACSRYMKEDALLVACLLGTAVAAVRAAQERKTVLVLLSGILAGLAASSKYSGALAVLMVAGIPWLASGRLMPDKRLLLPVCIALALVPAAFLAGTPYALLDFARFSNGFRLEQAHMARGHTVAVDAWSQLWMYHFARSILPGMTVPVALFATAMLGLLLWRRRTEDLFLVALVFLFYLPAEWVKAKPAPQPERYILPCLPFLALAAAEGIRFIRERYMPLLAALLAAAAMGFPAVRSIQLASELPNDTRLQMAAWISSNIPRGSKIMADWKPYDPPITSGYEMIYPPHNEVLGTLTLGRLRRTGYDYLLVSSLFYDRFFTEPNATGASRQVIRALFEYLPIVKQFRPQYGTYGFNNPTITLFSLKAEDFERLAEERARKERGELEKTSNETDAVFRWSIGR